MDEALEEDPKQISPEKRDDWQEVRNYVTAMNQAISSLESLPLSMRLLCDAHATLMQGVRGERKTPGEIRRSQNWIGGATPVDAVFVPPSHEELPDLLSDLERFWHDETIVVPDLIRVAISHYQFETIHPFLDGNGRIGRLLITLYLVSKKLLHKPTLYLSAHLERHRATYFDVLTRVRMANDMAGWIKFFLVAVSETAKRGCTTFQRILALKTASEQKVLTLGKRAEQAVRLLQLLYQKPFINTTSAMQHLNISQPTADRLISDLQKLGILIEMTGKQRGRQFYFRDYFYLFLE
jgi:Fic family protein